VRRDSAASKVLNVHIFTHRTIREFCQKTFKKVSEVKFSERLSNKRLILYP
jgi:hypothetical protein